MIQKAVIPKLNVVFTGFPYPQGLADTKDNQHAIDALKKHGASVRVIVLRQSTKINSPKGIYNGVPYETIGPDLWRTRFLLTSPVFFIKSVKAIRMAFRPDSRNVFFVYGPPNFNNFPMIRQARKCGYKIVFYIVEDDDVAWNRSSSLWSKATNCSARWLSKRISGIADGIIVISSHLQDKFRDLTRGKVPILLRYISVDTARISYTQPFSSSEISLFYAGIFGVKDGVENLLEAFDSLAPSYPRLRLVLSGGRGPERMRKILDRIKSSPFHDRIKYAGYLPEEEYYRLLSSVDIPCVPRVDSLYANAGFPFKLGEFLASGKPVIASRVSDVEKFISDREHAILINPGSIDDIVSGVRYLIENPDRAIQIGINGRKKAVEKFDVGVQRNSLCGFLEMVAQT
jgi:glycosyltransferase involved in cell wall biosynthesis